MGKKKILKFEKKIFLDKNFFFQNHLLPYTEKLARKDIQLENLKTQNKEFSKRIRLLQDKILEIDDKHEKDILQYKDRIATAINPQSRTVSNSSSDTKNEDYIKNVLFNYLIMPAKSPGKVHMMSALAAALHFTSEELNRVKAVQKLKWGGWGIWRKKELYRSKNNIRTWICHYY